MATGQVINSKVPIINNKPKPELSKDQRALKKKLLESLTEIREVLRKVPDRQVFMTLVTYNRAVTASLSELENASVAGDALGKLS